jgi:hypothetical protein
VNGRGANQARKAGSLDFARDGPLAALRVTRNNSGMTINNGGGAKYSPLLDLLKRLVFGSVAAEEAVLFPLRTVVVVGDIDQQAAYDFFVFGSGVEIDWLLQVV